MIGNILTAPGGCCEAAAGSAELHDAAARRCHECAQSQRARGRVRETSGPGKTSIACHNTAPNALELEGKVEQKPHIHYKLHTVTPAM